MNSSPPLVLTPTQERHVLARLGGKSIHAIATDEGRAIPTIAESLAAPVVRAVIASALRTMQVAYKGKTTAVLDGGPRGVGRTLPRCRAARRSVWRDDRRQPDAPRSGCGDSALRLPRRLTCQDRRRLHAQGTTLSLPRVAASDPRFVRVRFGGFPWSQRARASPAPLGRAALGETCPSGMAGDGILHRRSNRSVSCFATLG